MRLAVFVFMAALVGGLGSAAPAAAQGAGGKWEIGGGGVFVGGSDLGSVKAELTSNTGTNGGTFDFFSTDSKIKPAFGVVGRIGFVVTPALTIEGGLRFTRPVLDIHVTDDSEGAVDTTASETISQYLIEGSAVWHVGGSPGRGTVPFIYGGAGYLRELHEGDALVEDGLEFHAGAGIKVGIGSSGRAGVRADAGISVRDGGFDLDEGRRVVPVASGSLFYRF